MNATKRKFNALLQGLSSPRPSTSDNNKNHNINDDDSSSNSNFHIDNMNATSRHGSSLATNDEILLKRRRLGFPESNAPTLYSTSPVTTSFSNVILRRSATQLSNKPPSRAPAKYCPGDRDELLTRLATFQEITDWTPKPDKVNEIEWAKRGWICQGKEKVRCVLCHKELIVKLNKKENVGTEVSVLVSSEICKFIWSFEVSIYWTRADNFEQRKLWWKNTLIWLFRPINRIACGENAAVTATLAALRQRYDELCSRSPFLPYEFNLRLPDDVNIDDVLSQLPPDFFTTPPPAIDKSGSVATDKPPNRTALALALMGWQGLTNSRIGAVPNSASCHTCLRRLGLWMFKSKEVDEQGQIVVPAPMDHLDPLREHRLFCPWKSANAQSRGAVDSNKHPELTGWRTLIQTVKNESDLRNIYSGKSRRVGQPRDEGIGSPNPSGGAPGTPGSPGPATPTPKKGTDVALVASPVEPVGGGGEEDDKVREAKDKERWARLRKVKSLFDTKGSRKSRREPPGRPATGHSNK